MSKVPPSKGPLRGIRVLELGQLIAGPFAGSILGYFGAEVIKVENPGGGDPLRQWRVVQDGTSLWWHSLGRNKKSVTINMREPRGIELVRQLACNCDVLIENFRPGTLERWGLAPEDLKAQNPNLIVARISGYGQTGPYAHKPGFASVCEGISGFRYVNGFPGEPPVRPNLSLGDSLAGLHAALGVALAIIERERNNTGGQTVDIAIFESIFNMMEAVIPEFDGAGVMREPSGSTLTGIAPTNTYLCADGRHIVIGANGDSIYRRLMEAIDRDDLAQDPRFADNPGRVEHVAELDAAINTWTRQHAAEAALATLEAADVPCGPIYNAADMLADPHFQARGLYHSVEIDGKPLKLPAITPYLDRTPGSTRWSGPTIGAHNQDVLGGVLGLSDSELSELTNNGIV
jgi:crotonobetainyl-CoA:carnitine CoA-transferase CaiB-like acyl-CoA transferase